MTNQLILASGSPRRKHLLAELGVNFQIVVSDIDETVMLNELPVDYVARLAEEKCQAVLEKAALNTCVLAADTSVILNESILGKPENEEEAVNTLLKLSGRWHKVLTAVSIGNQIAKKTIVVESHVEFSLLNENICRAYWRTGEPRDKAGSYGIQGKGARFVKQIKGSYSSIVGLPVLETSELLEEFKIPYWLY